MKNLLPVLFTLTALCAITFAPAIGQGGSVNNAPGVYGGDEYIGTLPLEDSVVQFLKGAPYGTTRSITLEDGSTITATPVEPAPLVIEKRVPWLARGDCLEIVHEDRTAISLQVISSNDIPDGPIGLIAPTVSQSWRNGYYTNTLTTVVDLDETEAGARARLAAAVLWLQTYQAHVIP